MQLHELCKIFPPLDDDSYKALRDDIKAHGLRNPIILYGDEVLDGQNRLRACQELEIEPKFIRFEGDDVVDFVLAQNLHRRHLKPGQAATIVALAQDWSKAHSAGRSVEVKETVNDRTKQSGASRRTQLSADKLAKEAPELAQKVANGEVSLNKAVKTIEVKPQEDTKASKQEEKDDGLGEDIDLCDLYEQEVKENKRLQSIIEALSGDDSAKEIISLHEKVKALEGRLSKAIATEAEAVKQAKYYSNLLTSIRKVLSCENNSDILLRIKALK